MAKRAAAAVAWDIRSGARRDAEFERVMAMRERDELDYFSQSPHAGTKILPVDTA